MGDILEDPKITAYMQFDQLGDTYDTFSRSPFRQYLEFPSTFAAIGDISGLSVLGTTFLGVYIPLSRTII